MDVDNFSGGADIYGDNVPRLDPPLRLVGPDTVCPDGDDSCGVSGTIFPYQDPDGKHDIHPPGTYLDRARDICEDACAAARVTCDEAPEAPEDGEPSCEAQREACDDTCDEVETFDIGHFYMNLFGRYITSGGKNLDFDACNAWDDCADKQPVPPSRPMEDLQ